ncbi:MFS general substrate transporter [Schizophyllum commune H4-8]|uniref:MFS general substrate transporter n=1 Tax=Schizophyllum commune (strain H4-8 / FGSC 9210) TaxID=578458 RepID=UPI00215DEBF8|nr:MFS general substrate transporter [Schizophyllum commune H4-8]KAI5885704.1 MFS general substrate transporter [Schizophyllum commune H4-8]
MSGPAYDDSEKALETPMTPAFDVKAISHSQDATGISHTRSTKAISHNLDASSHTQDSDPEKCASTNELGVQGDDLERRGSGDAIEGDGAFPRGKWKAWSTVIGAFLIQFYVVGILTGFGVFQEYYTTAWLPRYTTSDISWIGGVQYMFELGLGPVAGRLYDAGYGRLSTLLGSFISMFSFFMLSLVKPNQYYQVFLVQGVGMGLGLMFVFGTTMTMVSQHFRGQRALAMGIVAASAPLGSIMYTILLNHLFHGPVGFAWGMRYVAFATLGCFVVGNAMLYSPVKEGASGPGKEGKRSRSGIKFRRSSKTDSRSAHSSSEAESVDTQPGGGAEKADGKATPNTDGAATPKTDGAATPKSDSSNALEKEESTQVASPPVEAPLWDLPFVLVMISALLWSLGATPPNFYMQLYAELHGVNEQLCFYSFAILSFASIFGRILPGWMADRWGAAEVFVPSLAVVGLISFAMFGCRHPAGLVIFALIFGYFFGTVIAMYMPMVASMTPEGAGMGRRLGVSLTPVGIGSFVGPPMVGAILGPNYDWWKTIVFSGVMVLSACAFNITAVVIFRRRARAKAAVTANA